MLTALSLLAVAPILVRLPVGTIVPSVARDGDKTYVAYGDRSDGFASSLDEASNQLSPPVRVNSIKGSVLAGGERGPRVAAGSGLLHAAWQDPNHSQPKVWYARSANGGKGFASQRNLLQGSVGVDMVTVAARGRNVVVLWIDARGGEDPQNPVANPIYFVESRDGGNSFGPNQRLVSTFNGAACACCTFDASFAEDGTLQIAYRTGYRNVRDVWLLERAPGASGFEATRISDDRWTLKTCPMDGPRFCEAPGRSVAAWMSDGRVYWAERAGASFQPRRLLTDGIAKYPSVVRTGSGETLGVWEAGGRVHWKQLPDGDSGSFTSSSHRSAVFVGADGAVRIVN